MAEGKSAGKSAVRGVFRLYHGLVCLLLFLGGGALLGYSIYLQVTNQGLLPDLPYEGAGFVRVLLTSAVAGIIVGGAIMVIALIGFIAFNRGCCGVMFGIIYTIALIAVMAVLLFAAVVTLKFVTGNNQFEEKLRNGWTTAITGPNKEEYQPVACEIQLTYECKGFIDNDCNGCDPYQDPSSCSQEQLQVCPSCPSTPSSNAGCYNTVVDAYHKFFLPIGIVATALAALAFMDIVVIWVM
eukprot:Plantae.Rhodophyta-Purpureofilum_apyrenoidigerum.ctg2900.p1 GENE.Plantae.Rhodophyta-Purpureofilum_apyrenoidigerum.ctg2900~~Plantae.Rhodophyta-Purpureofilum_apyrenoidigerum.ctg2900.p1  ORF type:complete len:240 (+),score=31.74 Plantae.Rhodophyta-Purpureofilum_apyrenoidigerum.ctg2900:149-868(+)